MPAKVHFHWNNSRYFWQKSPNLGVLNTVIKVGMGLKSQKSASDRDGVIEKLILNGIMYHFQPKTQSILLSLLANLCRAFPEIVLPSQSVVEVLVIVVYLGELDLKQRVAL